MRKIIHAFMLTALIPVISQVRVPLAQTSSDPAPASSEGTATPSTPPKPNMRFFQQFETDAAIIDRQWYSGELRWQSGAVPPLEDASGFLLTPLVAVSPVKDLEIGGKVSWIDYRLDNSILRPGTTRRFRGTSGLGDLTLWGKYRFLQGPVSVSAGVEGTLPTGSEDDGLGTGKFVPAAFGAVRIKAGPGDVLGEAGLRFNQNATILNSSVDAKTSTFLGAGYIWEGPSDLAFSGEVTVESERFKGGDTDIRATAGVQWLGLGHHVFRGAVGVGLASGAPDFELILGYAYAF